MKIGSLDFGYRPLFLAPMEDVTDSPFRQICRKMGASVVYTEFISSEAVIREVDRAMHKMSFEESERPFGIQLFGGREEAMDGAARIAVSQKPDLIDINFGCPVYKIVDKGAGAACLRDLGMMERMAKTVVAAVREESPQTPVTVKTRLGWDEDSIHIQEVALMLQEAGIQALTVHARTRNQKYTGTARWEWLARIKETPGFTIPLIGNGDVTSAELALKMFEQTGVDGVMIGRGAIGNPWIFSQTRDLLDQQKLMDRSHPIRHPLLEDASEVTASDGDSDTKSEPSTKERIDVCMEQLRLSVEHHGERYGTVIMKKHYGSYLKGIRGGKALRARILEYKDPEPIFEELSNFQEEMVDAVA